MISMVVYKNKADSKVPFKDTAPSPEHALARAFTLYYFGVSLFFCCGTPLEQVGSVGNHAFQINVGDCGGVVMCPYACAVSVLVQILRE